MTEHGSATVRLREDGTVTVLQADEVIGAARELLEGIDSDHYDPETGILTLDTAGKYRYERTGESVDHGRVWIFRRIRDQR